MTPSFDVIVCGSLHLDIVVNTKLLPRVDETAVGRSWQQVCGGKGGNQAVQAARAGAKTAMIGCVGNDAFGKTLQANLISEGVDTSCLAVDPTVGSGMSVAILQDNGDYGAVIVSGSNVLIDASSVSQHWAKIGGGKILCIQNEIPHSVNVAAAKLARVSGAQVLYNAAPARDFGQDILEFVDVLIVNRIEAEAMSGIPVVDRASAHLALAKLASASPSVIITLGGEGLVVASKGHDVLEIEPIPVQVTSSHGAGDCFVGTLCAELARGQLLAEACQVANRAAAAFVSRVA